MTTRLSASAAGELDRDECWFKEELDKDDFDEACGDGTITDGRTIGAISGFLKKFAKSEGICSNTFRIWQN